MKKYAIILCMLIPAMLLQAEAVWTGNASVGTADDFSGTAYTLRAASNTFPPGTALKVVNPRTGRSVEVVVTQRLSAPGVFIMLEAGAAQSLQLPPGQVMPLRVIPLDGKKLAYGTLGDDDSLTAAEKPASASEPLPAPEPEPAYTPESATPESDTPEVDTPEADSPEADSEDSVRLTLITGDSSSSDSSTAGAPSPEAASSSPEPAAKAAPSPEPLPAPEPEPAYTPESAAPESDTPDVDIPEADSPEADSEDSVRLTLITGDSSSSDSSTAKAPSPEAASPSPEAAVEAALSPEPLPEVESSAEGTEALPEPASSVENSENTIFFLMPSEPRPPKPAPEPPQVAAAEPETAVAESDTAVSESDTAVAASDTAVSESDTAVAESDTAVAESDTAVAEADTAVAASDTAVAEATPADTESFTESADSAPLALPGAPLDSGDRYVQLGAYSQRTILEETARRINNRAPGYPLCYAPNPERNGEFKLLVGPLRPAEVGIVLQTVRSAAFPDAFLYTAP